jgi:hypothetical protein
MGGDGVGAVRCGSAGCLVVLDPSPYAANWPVVPVSQELHHVAELASAVCDVPRHYVERFPRERRLQQVTTSPARLAIPEQPPTLIELVRMTEQRRYVSLIRGVRPRERCRFRLVVNGVQYGSLGHELPSLRLGDDKRGE